MKTYILTFNNASNHGALLQCYALYKIVSTLCIETKVVNLQFNKEKILRKFKISRSGFKEQIFNFRNINKYFDFFKARKRMVKFHNSMLSLTKPVHNMKELKSIASDASIYIVGSDQVWNPCFSYPEKFNEQFLLEWVPEHAKRYSYAASMGHDYLPLHLKERFKDALSKFQDVSFRENSSSISISKEFGIMTRTDIDPVFLLEKEDWEKILPQNRIFKDPYILIFELSTPDYFKDVVKEIKKLTDKKIVLISRNFYSTLKGDIQANDAGPTEFLRWIYDADFIVTTSFHATAFSIIFNKNFYSCLSKNPPERIINMLREFDLQKQILNEANYKDINLQIEVDYSNVKKKLYDKRAESLKYLQSILKEV